MKRAFLFIVVSLLFALGGCKPLKDVPTSVTEVKHTKDSTVFVYKELVDTLFIPKQTIEAYVSMDQLKQLKEYTFSNQKGLTTKIIYRDSSLHITTQMDSLMKLFVRSELSKGVYKKTDQQRQIIIKDYKSDNNIWFWITVLALIIYLIIIKLKSTR
jgi:hypothetical protein